MTKDLFLKNFVKARKLPCCEKTRKQYEKIISS